MIGAGYDFLHIFQGLQGIMEAICLCGSFGRRMIDVRIDTDLHECFLCVHHLGQQRKIVWLVKLGKNKKKRGIQTFCPYSFLSRDNLFFTSLIEEGASIDVHSSLY